MSEHTPGPWEVREEHVGTRVVRRVIHDHNRSGRGHKPIATVHEGFTRTEADARLIAAAPDLLAACELLQDFWASPDSGVEIPTILHAIKAATAKARGEPVK